MAELRSDTPLQYVRGVGPRRAQALETLGLRTVGDLLEYFPFRYEIQHGQMDIEQLRPGMHATIRGEVMRVRGRYPGFVADVHDGTDTCRLRWFNRPKGGRGLYVGAMVVASGEIEEYDGELVMVQPSVQLFAPGTMPRVAKTGPRRVGVYSGNQEVPPIAVRRAVESVLAAERLPVAEFLPRPLIAKHDLPGRAEAIRELHSPKDDESLARARRRLAYEELLLLELAMALRRKNQTATETAEKLAVTPEIDQRIRARFPFPLTAAQDQVIREIAADMAGGRPMTRLLQGDVGSGKTVVALYACLLAVAYRRQAAIMAPTEILAQQHFRNIARYLEDSRVRYALLRGGMPPAERAALLAATERGAVDLIVGTQALIQQDVSFHQLGLVVVDEQHKFGVLQRHQFRTKGPLPHYLVMTATPIPRTLALTVFGDLDVSLIKQSPPGRGRIITRSVVGKQWDSVMIDARQRLEAGEQAYVVCPVIGERPAGSRPDLGLLAEPDVGAELKSVRHTYQQLVTGPWRGLRVGLLHGGLPPAQKEATIRDFVAGRLHAIVATTVVEVGVDVPNATIMVIEHADRFGLSQLHQLRGRIGRGARDSLCVLIARDRGGKSQQRLEVMVQTTDGFAIAEADLRLRGPGQLFGTKQHGLPELRVAHIVEDFQLLEAARADAFAIAREDPRLALPEHAGLLPALRKLFGEQLALIDAA